MSTNTVIMLYNYISMYTRYNYIYMSSFLYKYKYFEICTIICVYKLYI